MEYEGFAILSQFGDSSKILTRVRTSSQNQITSIQSLLLTLPDLLNLEFNDRSSGIRGN